MDTPLAAALKAARVKLGISLREVAKRAGVVPMNPCNWERGVKPMTLQLPAIAKAYGIPEEELWQLRRLKRAARRSKVTPKCSGMLPFKRLSGAPRRKVARA